MSTEANLNAGRPVQVGAHSPEPGVSDKAVEAAEYAYEAFGAGMRDALAAALPHLQPQPVASRPTREQIAEALHHDNHVLGSPRCRQILNGDLTSCYERRMHDADAVLALMGGASGVNSTLYTCPGCGVNVIGHERCGDPTRPGCAS